MDWNTEYCSFRTVRTVLCRVQYSGVRALCVRFSPRNTSRPVESRDFRFEWRREFQEILERLSLEASVSLNGALHHITSLSIVCMCVSVRPSVSQSGSEAVGRPLDFSRRMCVSGDGASHFAVASRRRLEHCTRANVLLSRAHALLAPPVSSRAGRTLAQHCSVLYD